MRARARRARVVLESWRAGRRAVESHAVPGVVGDVQRRRRRSVDQRRRKLNCNDDTPCTPSPIFIHTSVDRAFGCVAPADFVCLSVCACSNKRLSYQHQSRPLTSVIVLGVWSRGVSRPLLGALHLTLGSGDLGLRIIVLSEPRP